MEEAWRVIDGCPRYAVSNLGRVRRELPGIAARAGRILKPYALPYGHQLVTLTDTGGRRIKRLVHRLVCFAFLGPPPTPHHEAAHWDGDPSNNNLTNLRWATKTENGEDASRHGRSKGEKHPNAKLTAVQAKEIFERLANGEGGSKLAREYDISPMTVSDIKRGILWSHVTGIIGRKYIRTDAR